MQSFHAELVIRMRQRRFPRHVFFCTMVALSTMATTVAQQPSPQPNSDKTVASSVEPAKPHEPPEKTAWQLLRGAATNNNVWKRQTGILALGTLGPSPRAVNLVRNALLTDKETAVRQTAASALAEMKARGAIPALRKALDDNSAVVRFAAAKALWQMGDHSGRDILIEVLQGESSPSEGFIKSSFTDADKKLHDRRALAMMGINEASGALLGPFSMGVKVAEQLMKDNTAPARAVSAELLATDHDPRSVRDLDNALRDKNWAVREAAAKALGNYRCPSLIADLEPLLEDKKDEVKVMAAASILRISGARATTIPSECAFVPPATASNQPVQAAAESTQAPPQTQK